MGTHTYMGMHMGAIWALLFSRHSCLSCIELKPGLFVGESKKVSEMGKKFTQFLQNLRQVTTVISLTSVGWLPIPLVVCQLVRAALQ